MPLPIVTLKSDEHWDCHQCGVCCHGSIVPLTADDAERLHRQGWEQTPEFRTTPITTRHASAASSLRLAHREDGTCVFLNESGLCRIHEKFGIEAKPIVCQTFPLQLIPHGKHAVMTIRRACPSAAAGLGDVASTRLPKIKQWVREGQLKAESTPPPKFKTGESRDWRAMESLFEEAGGLLRDSRYPPVRRMVHALQFANHLEAAKTRRMDHRQLAELARTLAEWEPEESKPLFEDRRVPKTYSKILLRRTAIVAARLHPDCRHRANWAARVELSQIAWKVLRGKGRLPTFNGTFPSCNFQDLETSLGVQPVEVYEPLTRFIETTSESCLYAIANRGDWSLIESIRGLALLFPVGMWLLRWLSHGRDPTVEDMIQVVVMLDRSQGYGPLCGFAHRQLIATLSLQQELERLVIWYAS